MRITESFKKDCVKGECAGTGEYFLMSKKSSQKVSRLFKIIIGPLKLTKYERARIIGARALQLSYGAPSFIPRDELYNVTEIAKRELQAKALPISIRRQLPDNTYQDIALQYLL